MSENTKIEWADHSWSPWRGCTKVSPGCANCYAETLSKRNPAVLGQWGKGKPRVLAKNWGDPVRWQKRTSMDMPRPRVFPSLCDWLDEEVSTEWRVRFLRLMFDTPHLNWLLLTKRPDEFHVLMARCLDAIGKSEGFPKEGKPSPFGDWAVGWLSGKASPDNVWFGVSVEDQKRADERIPILLQIPAVVRWLSLEPLLGPVDLTEAGSKVFAAWRKLHWLVIGGESGHGARPCNVEWVRSLKDQGKHAGVPVFVKQLGANPHCDCGELPAGGNAEMMHPKGGDPSEWPADLRVREFPEVKP